VTIFRHALSYLSVAALTTVLLCRSAVADELEVKAAFIYNFLKFVRSPRIFSNGTVNLCVLTREAALPGFDALQTRTAQDRPIRVLFLLNLRQPTLCAVVYVHSPAEPLPDLLAKLKGTGALTVGERQEFLEQGGMISFVSERPRIRFDVNVESMKREDIIPTSHLLKVARIVLNPGT
jgi:hypothetical protein